MSGRPSRGSLTGWLAGVALASGALVAGTLAPVTSEPAPGGATVQPAAESRPRTVRIASFNLLGWGHTERGALDKQYADGEARMARSLRLLKKHRINLVGFQELQRPQYDRFLQLTDDRWAVYPGARHGDFVMHNSIAWRRSHWKAAKLRTVEIPYFDGQLLRMPFVLLRNLRTDRMVWVGNFHNPADSHGDAERWRDAAERKQVQLAKFLRHTGHPTIFTGDFNERRDVFCRFTRRAALHAANGGSRGDGPCRPPRRMQVDWIFGSPRVDFTRYRVLDSAYVDRTSDHPLIVADARIRRR